MLDINSSFFLIREQKHSVTKKGEKHTAKCRSGTGCNFQPSSLTQLFSQQSSSSWFSQLWQRSLYVFCSFQLHRAFLTRSLALFLRSSVQCPIRNGTRSSFQGSWLKMPSGWPAKQQYSVSEVWMLWKDGSAHQEWEKQERSYLNLVAITWGTKTLAEKSP